MAIAIVKTDKIKYSYGRIIFPIRETPGEGEYPTKEEVEQEITEQINQRMDDFLGMHAEGVEALLPEINDGDPTTGILQQIITRNGSSPADDQTYYPDVEF